MTRTLIIAEAGVNHNGSLELALELVEQAHECGADIVKFQTFKAANLLTTGAEKAEYQKKNTGTKESQFEMIRKLELDEEAHQKIIMRCKELGIEFLSTAFDIESLHFLVEKCGVQRIKIPSGEITNGPLLLAAARTGKQIIMSTGMSTMGEIEQALSVLAFGYMRKDKVTDQSDFIDAYSSKQGQDLIARNVTLLHCTTEYPAPLEEVNLNVMDTLRGAFGLTVGYSDHTQGIIIPIAAVAKGAVVIEKHFTLDRNLPGPDHRASLEPNELRQMVESIRQVECALGSTVKAPTSAEMKNRFVVRKSVVAARPIKFGESFSEENLTIKRAGVGISPMSYWSLLGKPSNKSYEPDQLIE